MRLNSAVEHAAELDSAPVLLPDESPSAEAMRRTHLRAEADVRTIGYLVLIGVVLEILELLRAPGLSGARILLPGILIANAASGVLLRELKPLGRWLYTAATIIGLATVALETPAIIEIAAQGGSRLAPHWDYLAVIVLGIRAILSPLLAAILWRRRWRAVTSAHYRNAVIPASPHIEIRSNSRLLLALLGLAFLSIVACTMRLVIL